jgi:hypothetical protein
VTSMAPLRGAFVGARTSPALVQGERDVPRRRGRGKRFSKFYDFSINVARILSRIFADLVADSRGSLLDGLGQCATEEVWPPDARLDHTLSGIPRVV